MNLALRIAAFGLAAAALCSPTAAAVSSAVPRPQRIMSLNVCTDLLLLQIAPRARIASVTFMAPEGASALFPGAAAGLALNHGRAEDVINARPDLILDSGLGAPLTRTMARRVGARVVEVKDANSFADIRDIVRQVGDAVGEPARAAALIARMDATLADLAAHPPRRPLRVVAWSGGSAVPGKGSLTDAIITAAGAVNIAARAGQAESSFGVEELLIARPDALLYGGATLGQPSLVSDEGQHRVVRQLYAGRRIRYNDIAHTCGVPQSADSARDLRRALDALPPGRAGAMRTTLPPFVLPGVALLMLAAAALGSLFLGRVNISPAELWAGIVSPHASLAGLVVTELRLPRAVLAILVGASLGLSGAVLQGLLRNPLAEPGLLGVSNGAALGAVFSIYFGLEHHFGLATPLLGMAGAIGAGALTFLFGRGSTLTLILAGAAVCSLMSAFLALALNFAPSPYAAYEMSVWMLGSLAERSWDHVALAAPFIFAGLAILATMGRAVDALTLGEVQAKSLGIHIDRTRMLALLGVGLAVGAATSVTGSVGFIGLVAPHLCRPFVGHQPSRTLLPSALLGAVLLLLADIGTRVIHTNTELKLGAITSLLGAPFFFWLVLRLKRLAP